MVSSNEYGKIIWSYNGEQFHILDIQAFEHGGALKKHYGDFQTWIDFKRELNLFGFKASTLIGNTCTFSHKHFVRYQPERMKKIQRRRFTPSYRKVGRANIRQLPTVHEMTNQQMSSLTDTFEGLKVEKNSALRHFAGKRKSFEFDTGNEMDNQLNDLFDDLKMDTEKGENPTVCKKRRTQNRAAQWGDLETILHGDFDMANRTASGTASEYEALTIHDQYAVTVLINMTPSLKL